jgi:pyruvate dehydrogenase E2 component (dihydrolipoamide acetyltransferase)
MSREFTLPDVGEGIAEAELSAWLVDVGETVQEDQPVVEVETDKSLVEIPSPVDGVVAELHADVGDLVSVGETLVTFYERDAAGEDLDEEADTGTEAGAPGATGAEPAEPDVRCEDRPDAEPTDEAPPESDPLAGSENGRVFARPGVRKLAREHGVSIDDLAGSGQGGRVVRADVLTAAQGDDDPSTDDGAAAVAGGGRQPERSRDGSTDGPAADAPAEDTAESAGRDRTLTTPAVRRVAAELGVDLEEVPAVSRRGDDAVVKEDAVRRYASERANPEQSAGTAGREEPEAKRSSAVSEERVPYRGIRRTIGEQMERSRYTAPHVTRHQQVDATKLVEMREELAAVADEEGFTLTYMPFVMKAVTAGLMEFPFLNSSLDEAAEEIVLKGEYNLGVATATDAGLMVPVVDDVDRKGVRQIATELDDLARKARERTIDREELGGSTFTITNIGPIGGFFGTPIINYPEAAILALGEIKLRPWVKDGEVVAAHTLPLSLSYDHRIIDGATGARFMNAVMDHLRNPELLLLE